MLYAIAGEKETIPSKPCVLWASEIHVS